MLMNEKCEMPDNSYKHKRKKRKQAKVVNKVQIIHKK